MQPRILKYSDDNTKISGIYNIMLAMIRATKMIKDNVSKTITTNNEVTFSIWGIYRESYLIDYFIAEKKAFFDSFWEIQLKDMEMWSDAKFVKLAVKEDGSWIEYASSELRKNREIVLAAIQENRENLKFASEELQKELGSEK